MFYTNVTWSHDNKFEKFTVNSGLTTPAVSHCCLDSYV